MTFNRKPRAPAVKSGTFTSMKAPSFQRGCLRAPCFSSVDAGLGCRCRAKAELAVRLEEPCACAQERLSLDATGDPSRPFHLDEIRTGFLRAQRVTALSFLFALGTSIGGDSILGRDVHAQSVVGADIEEPRARRNTQNRRSGANGAGVFVGDDLRPEYGAESERVDQVDEHRRGGSAGVRREYSAIEKRVLSRAGWAPIPRDPAPDSPVVIVIRLRVRELLALTLDAQRSRRGCAERWNSVSRDKSSGPHRDSREIRERRWTHDQRDIRLAGLCAYFVVSIRQNSHVRVAENEIRLRRRETHPRSIERGPKAACRSVLLAQR